VLQLARLAWYTYAPVRSTEIYIVDTIALVTVFAVGVYFLMLITCTVSLLDAIMGHEHHGHCRTSPVGLPAIQRDTRARTLRCVRQAPSDKRTRLNHSDAVE
jgi:hypothetical protein